MLPSSESLSLPSSSTAESEAVNDESDHSSRLSSHEGCPGNDGLGERSPETRNDSPTLELVAAVKSSTLELIQVSSQQSSVDFVRHVVRLEDQLRDIQSQVRNQAQSIEELKGLASDANSLQDGILQRLDRLSECRLFLGYHLASWVAPSAQLHPPVVSHSELKKRRQRRRRYQARNPHRRSHCDSKYYDADDELSTTDSKQEGSHGRKVRAATCRIAHTVSESDSNEQPTGSETIVQHCSPKQTLAVLSSRCSSQEPLIPVAAMPKAIYSTNDM